MPSIDARKLLGKNFIIGKTANSFKSISDEDFQNIDYIGLGPFRDTHTKKNLKPILGKSGVGEFINALRTRKLKHKVIAIGGIRLEEIDEILNLGASSVALSSNLVNFLNVK